MEIIVAEESDSGSFSSHPCGPAGSMGICLRVKWKIVIYYVGDVAKIQTSACDVGCDNYFDLFLFKLIKNGRPSGLLYASVQKIDGINFLF